MSDLKKILVRFCSMMHLVFSRGLLASLALFLPILAQARSVELDAFLDTYYAYDFNRPSSRDRSFTTQPARHDEFNINLALLGANYTHDKVKARVSLQAGTYVQNNYSSEPAKGAVSGPDVSRHIQDAFIQYQLTQSSLVMAGIFPSHLGFESVFSTENMTYTRSMAADFSPYYQSGVGLIQDLSASWTFEAYVLNGWQNVSEDDENKALGLALRYRAQNFEANYSNYIGHYLENERSFHDFNATWRARDWLTLCALFDLGLQRSAGQQKFFGTFNTQAQLRLDHLQSLSFRIERYEDVNGLNVPTSNERDFSVWGYSVGYNRSLNDQTQFRVEWRYFKNDGGSIFPSREDSFSAENQFIVASLAMRM